MLTPSVVQAVPDVRARCQYDDPSNLEFWHSLRERLLWTAFVQPAQIPFRGGDDGPDQYDGFAVVPNNGDTNPRALSDSILNTLKRLRWLKSLAPNPQSQAKYNRTIMWLSEIHGQWNTAAFRLDQNPAWSAEAP